MPQLQRRHVLKASVAAAATGVMTQSTNALSSSPNEQVRMAVIGAGGRGGGIASAIDSIENAKLVMVADPDQGRAESLARKFQAKAVTDLRQVLDNPEVDAVAITTCNHWHCLASIWAIQANKHVYVEKPLSHSQWEGRRVVEAAKESGRIVQLGTQQRSDPIQMQAREFLHAEKALGEVRYVQANRLGVRGSIGKRETPLPVPKGVDYDLWLGPAAEQPIYREKFHYDWHWDWNTGSGEMGNWGVHILDDVRNVAYQDQVTTPTRMIAGGGRVSWDDAGQTPNLQFALFETETFPTLIALSNLKPDPKKSGKQQWNAKGTKGVSAPASGYAVACEGGYYLGQRGSGKAVDLEGKTIKTFREKVSTVPAHVQNFASAVQSGDASSLAAPVETGHHSTGWCNLANVAFRVGSTFDHDALVSSSDLEAWPSLIHDMISPLDNHGVQLSQLQSSGWLNHDPMSEQFTGDNADKANALLRREYRKGYEIS